MNTYVKRQSLLNYEDLIKNIFKKYTRRWVDDLHYIFPKLKDFQKELYKIPSWSTKKKHKEYSLFIKFIIKKFNKDEDTISYTLQKIFENYINIMSELIETPFSPNPPSLENVWFRIMKRVGKYFYENPKSDSNTLLIDDTVLFVLNKYININKYLSKEKNIESPFYYSFEKSDKHTTENPLPAIVEKVDSDEQSDSSLKYISSKQFENEYYNSDTGTGTATEKEKNIVFKK
jgi:hypothetical protein